MTNKKSQAALEFIMTYGWAILVVLVAVGALASFGVLSPDKFLPSKCVLQSGIACIDHKATSTSLDVRITNSGGYDITINEIKAQQCTAQTGLTTSLPNGQSTTLPLVCVNTGSTKYNGQFNITFTNVETGIQHTNVGQITSRVE